MCIAKTCGTGATKEICLDGLKKIANIFDKKHKRSKK